jgi:Putative peptidoglycan binding domain
MAVHRGTASQGDGGNDMNIQRGASGDNVQRIQQRLRDLGLYTGSIDSSFGGGTEAAVKNYQLQQKLPSNGVVDAATWAALFPGVPAPQPELAGAPLADRCLALTGSFETGNQPPDCFCGMTGDFDGQGLSFGALQWNIGQKTFQPLLARMIEEHEDVCRSIFHENLDTIRALADATLENQLDFVRSIQTRGQINEPWRGMLKTLGRTTEFREIQTSAASKLFQQAGEMCAEYGLTSQRAMALMFDICTQNGSIDAIVKSQILADFAALAAGSDADREVARMRIVANRRAAACKPQYIDDVRTRKLTIANGTGMVHGVPHDLTGVFCLTLEPFAPADAAGAND